MMTSVDAAHLVIDGGDDGPLIVPPWVIASSDKHMSVGGADGSSRGAHHNAPTVSRRPTRAPTADHTGS